MESAGKRESLGPIYRPSEHLSLIHISPAILWRHVIPNAAGPIAAYLAVLVPRVILLESFVSFLGLGVQEPLTSWGVLVADGARNIQGSIHLLIFPALFLGATLGALQSLGDGWRARGLDGRIR